jgi:hypothetical protein
VASIDLDWKLDFGTLDKGKHWRGERREERGERREGRGERRELA